MEELGHREGPSNFCSAAQLVLEEGSMPGLLDPKSMLYFTLTTPSHPPRSEPLWSAAQSVFC